jgi:hypothetical protein
VFPRLSEGDKEEAIEEYKRDIEAGRIQPTISNFSYTVTVSEIGEAAQMVELEASAYGQTFTSQMLCQADTMYLTRNKYPVTTEVNGRVLGYALQGVQTIPLTLEVGDVLPPFEDFTVVFPQNRTFSVQDSVIVDWKTESYVRYEGEVWNRALSRNEPMYRISGTTTTPIYERFDIEVRSASRNINYNRNYAFAVVSGEEEIDFLGRRGTALVIDAQSWGKTFADASFDATSSDLRAELGEIEANLAREHQEQFDRMQQMVVDMGYAEEGGYTVSRRRDWFVPGLGMVRNASFDKYGGLQNETILISIR